MMKALAVYLSNEYARNEYAGLLSCDALQRFWFQYDPDWMEKKEAPPLSLSLPLRKDAYPDEQARPFFANLLPESRVREAVARKLGVSPRNDFALLEALGGECAGAITLLPQGSEAPMEKEPPEYRELSPETLIEIIQDLPKKPFLAGDSGIRLSLAGAQDKLPVYMTEERIFLPQGASASSHILKPGIEGIDQSVRNEAFCMALAEKAGVSVPHAWVMKIPDPAGQSPAELYAVARYDRYRDDNGRIRRLHQEDFCQAMGLMAEAKYESEGGPCLADCFSLVDRFSTHPALDRKALLDWVAFNFLIHNADAHAKNLSIVLSPAQIRIAPFYDLMCTGVYEGINERLAMKIGGENRPQWIQSRHWLRMAEEVGVRPAFALQTARKMAKQLERAAPALASAQAARWGPSSITDRILKVIARQCKRL